MMANGMLGAIPGGAAYVLRRSQGALPTSSGHKRLRSMRFIGVNWNEDRSLWRVQLTDPQTKRQRHIGYFASEEDAARAYDCAAVHASGPGAERNFPGEAASKLPAAVGEEQKQGRSSRFIGVLWHKASSSWQVKLRDPLTKRQGHVGTYAYEEDAARAYFSAAVQANGPGAERNFPGEAANGLPVPVGTEQKQRGSSRFIGVCWHKASSSWQVKLRDPQTKRQQHIGTYASEEDAAHAYDRAAVQAHGPGAMRNFLGEAINEVPA
ncbi:hypothetical protein FOA52_012900 [Chlamydomonas sp. UWO 241]|nr:hypothetical protein FOA52_012900 [Chlamydomonas sp. UWO 241]